MSSSIKKYVGALVVAGLVGGVASQGASLMYGAAKVDSAKRGFSIEVISSAEAVVPEAAAVAAVAVVAASTPEVAEAAPAAALDLAAADAKAGETFFKQKCALCHNNTKGSAAKIGPSLYGVVGRPVGGTSFAYSAAMKGKGGKWGIEELNAYLTKPAAAIAGNKMAFPGIPDPKTRANVIVYLNSQSDSPLPVK